MIGRRPQANVAGPAACRRGQRFGLPSNLAAGPVRQDYEARPAEAPHARNAMENARRLRLVGKGFSQSIRRALGDCAGGWRKSTELLPEPARVAQLSERDLAQPPVVLGEHEGSSPGRQTG